MKVLMIGGTALIGPHLIAELSRAGCDTVTLTRSGRTYFCETALTGDRNDPSALEAAFNAAPDVVIDMIPFTAQDATHLLAAMGDNPPRLIALSSADIYSAYGILHGTETARFQSCPIPETGTLRTTLGAEGAAYDKLSVERIYGGLDNVTFLRLPAVYGWPDTTRVLPYLDQMLDGATQIDIPADKAAFRFSRALHKNVAIAIALAVLKCAVGRHVYNVAEPKAYTEQDWIARIAQACGWQGKVNLTKWRRETPSPRQQLHLDTTLIRRELGFEELYNVDEGLADCVAFHAYQRLGKPYTKYY
ncbi:MAG: NAD-dependent epimerase/dehydratase family protein [Litoreibacter sp.]